MTHRAVSRVMYNLSFLLGAVFLLAQEASAAVTPGDLRALVSSLSDPDLAGRAVGGPGCEKVSGMIAARFEMAGLKPAGDNGGWFQVFTPGAPLLKDAVHMPEGAQWGAFALRNVVGLLPGNGEECVIIGAHYDHLGREPSGAIFPGADDNASGVACLCAVASELAAEPARRRNILFIAFSGEEAGMLGSSWYADHPVRSLASTMAMINLDTVGRMEGRRLLALSASSAGELPEILKGVNLGFGLDLQIPEKGPFGSDQTSFLAKGVPAVHLFTGPNQDYHRPSDTPEKLNYEGLLDVAAFTAELARYLGDRDGRLTFVPPGADKLRPQPSAQAQTPRRVSLGTIPDMAFQGEGVLVSGVLPGSPAEKAGIAKEDRIISVDGESVAGLEDYSAILKSHKPGDTIHVTFVRAGALKTVEATLVERK